MFLYSLETLDQIFRFHGAGYSLVQKRCHCFYMRTFSNFAGLFSNPLKLWGFKIEVLLILHISKIDWSVKHQVFIKHSNLLIFFILSWTKLCLTTQIFHFYCYFPKNVPYHIHRGLNAQNYTDEILSQAGHIDYHALPDTTVFMMWYHVMQQG